MMQYFSHLWMDFKCFYRFEILRKRAFIWYVKCQNRWRFGNTRRTNVVANKRWRWRKSIMRYFSHLLMDFKCFYRFGILRKRAFIWYVKCQNRWRFGNTRRTNVVANKRWRWRKSIMRYFSHLLMDFNTASTWRSPRSPSCSRLRRPLSYPAFSLSLSLK